MTQFDRGDGRSPAHSTMIEGQAWSARGVSVLSSVAGIGRFHFGFSSDPRVAVLYGLNGSGKTRVLRHIAAAFGGAPAEVPVTLHVELHDPRYCPPSTSLTTWLWGSLIEFSRQLADRMEIEPITTQMVADRDHREFNYDYWVSKLLSEAFELETALASTISGAGRLALTVEEGGAASLAVSVALDDLSAVPISSDSFRDDALGPRTLEPFDWLDVVTGVYREPRQRLLDAAAFRNQNPSPPGWVSFPILTFARRSAYAGSNRAVIADLGSNSLDAAVLNDLRPEIQKGGAFAQSGPGRSTLHESVAEILHEINARANEVVGQILPDAPRVAIDLRDPESLLQGAPVLLEAIANAHRLPKTSLSEAHQYWYEVGVRLALARRAPDVEAGVIILDEPDRGLHPEARRHLAAGLSRIASATGLNVVVASHGAEMIAADQVDLWHVSREAGGDSVIRELDRPLLARMAEMERLGLGRVDLLQFLRLLVVVEGEHDRAVLEALLADDLAANSAHIVMLRGTDHLSSALDCQLLTQFTDADLVLVLDNTRHRVVSAWPQAQAASSRGANREARRLLAKAVPTAGASREEQKLATFLVDALSAPASDRLHIVGLEQPDITRYLPVEYFASSVKSWDELASVASQSSQGTVKRWLASHGVAVTTDSCSEAARLLDELPPDLVRLRDRLYQITGRSPRLGASLPGS